ncbi:Hypothetical protein PHPALM_13809 [Phytophthora palmivora]|uniref:PiggyBac transposable element-derived protein domain-containing protein n=1 Tax=Phytophthora palmivora TaxID=4796 RepID=A0A2P4XWD2_9STRA|nr:Hypothetical protein PHPALM_13809 [Phytophthora palmivora]
MTERIDSKEFKRLWRALVKPGWKARPPSGLDTEHTYVKPGVKGRLQKDKTGVDYFVGSQALWAFSKREGLIQPLLSHPPRKQANLGRPPMGKQAAYEATQKQMPASPQSTGSVDGTAAVNTEQAGGVNVTVPADTEQAGGDTTVAADTEQAGGMEDGAAANAEQYTAGLPNGEIALEAFDSPRFIDAMRAERLFGPVAADDVNISDHPLAPEEEVESISDPVDAPANLSDYYESEVESDYKFEGENSGFAQDDTVMRAMAATGWEVYDQHHSEDLQLEGSGDLYSGTWGITRSAAAYASSPLGMFFYFIPKKLWYHIAKDCTTRQAAYAKDPIKNVQSLEVLIEKLTKTRSIKAHEVLHVVGLLIARSLCSHMDGLDQHWRTEEDGAIPWGTFGRYMTRDRFTTILRYLHFQNSSAEVPTTDRAWKVRPILQTLQRTFRRGYRLGERISFDEGTIPNRSKFNPVRVYNKDKPHKYGTKVYMTCCAESGYCSRIEVYMGASDEAKHAKTPVERKTAAKGVAQKAMIRNITKALNGQPGKRLIVADNFYSSCALALELLEKGYYYVGTHRNDRLGWPSGFAFTQKKRPVSMPRGTYRIAQCKDHPNLVAVSWMYSKTVNLIATGCATTPTTVTRKEKGCAESRVVPCPKLLADYHSGMGGVDRHD